MKIIQVILIISLENIKYQHGSLKLIVIFGGATFISVMLQHIK